MGVTFITQPTTMACKWGAACAICTGKYTKFRADVYHAAAEIAPGTVVTYSALARLAGNSGASRAVGAAMAANKLNVEGATPRVPCHRVIRKDLSMAGFNGGGTEIKERMLRDEGVEVVRGRVAQGAKDRVLF